MFLLLSEVDTGVLHISHFKPIYGRGIIVFLTEPLDALLRALPVFLTLLLDFLPVGFEFVDLGVDAD